MISLAVIVALALQDADVPDLGTRKEGADWPCFLGPHHDGTTPEQLTNLNWAKRVPRPAWQRHSRRTGVFWRWERAMTMWKTRFVCWKSQAAN